MNWHDAEQHLRSVDPTMATIIELVGPCTLIPEASGFATLADAIISQQISVKAANAIAARVTLSLGALAPEPIAAATVEQLRALGLSQQKARYLLDLAEKTLSGAVDFAALPHLDDETAIGQLIQVKGIGRWTAEMYLMFGLARPDILPVDDLGLRQAVQRWYGLTDPPKPLLLRQLAEPWRPYRSIATWYLWRSKSQ